MILYKYYKPCSESVVKFNIIHLKKTNQKKIFMSNSIYSYEVKKK